MEEKTVASTLAGLLDYGRRLVFIDESGTSGEPLPETLVSDYKVVCGVALGAAAYCEAKTSLETWLVDHRLGSEFHATDILGRKGEWAEVSLETRMAALSFLADTLVKTDCLVYYCFIGGKQHQEFLYQAMSQAQEEGLLNGPTRLRASLSQDEALKIVFIGALLDRTPEARNRGLALVADSRDPRNSSLRIDVYPPIRGADLYEHGVIHADSRDVPGLQLADLAAYSLNRGYHIKHRLKIGKDCGPFDPIIIEMLQGLNGRITNLLAGSEP